MKVLCKLTLRVASQEKNTYTKAAKNRYHNWIVTNRKIGSPMVVIEKN